MGFVLVSIYSIRILCKSEAVVRRCSLEKMLLEISQNVQENTSDTVSFLIKFFSLKKRFWHKCFPMNFEKFLKTPFFFTEHPLWLALRILLEVFYKKYGD